MNLRKKTQNWVEDKIITSSQQEAILAREGSQDLFRWGIVLLGIFCVGLGIISMIAAGWDMIPDSVKLGGAFLILINLLIFSFVGLQKKIPFLGEGCLFGAFLMCGATIGLVGQIFHLGDNLSSALLLWAVVTFPLVIISRRRLIGLLWIPIALDGFVPAAGWRALYELYSIYPIGSTLVFGSWLWVIASLFGLVQGTFAGAIRKGLYILLYANFIFGDFLLSDNGMDFIGFIITVLFLTVATIINIRNGNTIAFRQNLFLIALRLVVLYFQVFISLAFTGVGFILSGGVILAAVWGWNKINTNLSIQTKGDKV